MEVQTEDGYDMLHEIDISSNLNNIYLRLQRLSSPSNWPDSVRFDCQSETIVNIETETVFYKCCTTSPSMDDPQNIFFDMLSKIAEEMDKLERIWTRSKLHQLNEEKENVLNRNKKLEEEVETLKSRLNKVSHEKEFALSSKMRLEKEVVTLSQEKEEALTRLSKIAGSRLYFNNPGIADLSDTNRPLKIGEKFNEVYDNEWTDALETLTRDFGFNEIQAINSLRTLLMETYETCQKQAEKQLEKISEAVFLKYDNSDESEDSCNDAIEKDEILKKALVDFQKSVSEHSSGAITKFLRQDPTFRETFKNEISRCETYFCQCVNLCWLMCVQSPPLYLDFGGQETEEIDTKLFKFFTKTGNKSDYTVWPALFLYENGNLLQKGVVQPH